MLEFFYWIRLWGLLDWIGLDFFSTETVLYQKQVKMDRMLKHVLQVKIVHNFNGKMLKCALQAVILCNDTISMVRYTWC